jgi:hypothetical protein
MALHNTPTARMQARGALLLIEAVKFDTQVAIEVGPPEG